MIDETPNGDPKYSAEHDLTLTATGSSVTVTADDSHPIATITRSGWYTFVMTFENAGDANPVATSFQVYDENGKLVSTPLRVADRFAGARVPILLGSGMNGNGYLWFSWWQNGFAGDVLAIDNLRVGPLSDLKVAP
jgi:hypothetical protein